MKWITQKILYKKQRIMGTNDVPCNRENWILYAFIFYWLNKTKPRTEMKKKKKTEKPAKHMNQDARYRKDQTEKRIEFYPKNAFNKSLCFSLLSLNLFLASSFDRLAINSFNQSAARTSNTILLLYTRTSRTNTLHTPAIADCIQIKDSAWLRRRGRERRWEERESVSDESVCLSDV